MEINRNLVTEILNQIAIEGSIYPSSDGLNFRCVICGDSKKSKSKRRGWVLFNRDNVLYYCFNCGYSKSFYYFLKEEYPDLFQRYLKPKSAHDIFNRKKQSLDITAKIIRHQTPDEAEESIEDVSEKVIPFSFKLVEKNIKGMWKKELQQIALKTVIQRKIPKKYWKDFLVCYDKTFVDRLIIPYFDKEGLMYCFQGRSLSGREPKYLTWNKDNIKIFNYFHVLPRKLVGVTEGPIDSMFLKNCISTSGTITPDNEQFDIIKEKFPKRFWLFDNPYLDEAGLERAILFAEAGEQIFIWPKEWKRFKDINEIVEADILTNDEIHDIILSRIYKGITAITRMKLLKK